MSAFTISPLVRELTPEQTQTIALLVARAGDDATATISLAPGGHAVRVEILRMRRMHRRAVVDRNGTFYCPTSERAAA